MKLKLGSVFYHLNDFTFGHMLDFLFHNLHFFIFPLFRLLNSDRSVWIKIASLVQWLVFFLVFPFVQKTILENMYLHFQARDRKNDRPNYKISRPQYSKIYM
jgi:hypothetical protein